MLKGKILIIDDEDKLRSLMARVISLEGFSVTEASTIKNGLQKLEREDFNVVLCDVRLPDGNGIETVQNIKAKYPHIEVILLTAYGTIADGVKAMKNGAFDYITKGDDNDKIIPLLNKAMDKTLLQEKIRILENKLQKKYSFSTILGKSALIKNAVTQAQKVAATDASVLLLGETGTGKEVFAQAIHHESKRATKNFIAVNCAAFSREILESELFGHKIGSFTGAIKDKKGLFEEANGGTIFLDEIGEMNHDLQAKLLRVLENGTFIKVGETKETKVDVRVIAATNRDLLKENEKGNFRLDLFYRLSVFQISLPPLRDRKEDIKEIAEHFIAVFATKTKQKTPTMSKDFLSALQAHQWKGNTRELKNVIERSVILNDADVLEVSVLPYDFNIAQELNPSSFTLQDIEKAHIQKVLQYTKGNKTETAKLLNIGLTTLYRKMEEYGV